MVVHFAAETHVDRSLMSAGEFINTDVFGTFVLLEAARQAPGLRRFVQISTDEVYGAVLEGSSLETDELKPRNPYSASKAGADRLAYSYWATYDVPVIITRASNNYGPFHFPEKVIPLFITNAIDDIPVPLYGDGQQERDWLHVSDHCRAVDRLIEHGTPGEVYNVGGGNHVRNADLTRQILDLLGKPHSPDPAGRGPPRTRPPLLGRYGQAARRRMGAAGAVRRRPAADGRVVPAERVVVAADQGGRPGLPRLPRRAVRQTPLSDAVPGPLLVTGGAGFAGSHLIDHLAEGRTPVAAWSHRGGQAPSGAPPGVRWSAVDLLDRDAVRDAVASLAPSVIYHCAGAAHVGSAWTDPVRPLRVNALGTHHVIEAVRAARLSCPVLVTGSALVYRPSAEPIAEDDPLAPVDPYGVSKLAQEALALRAGDVAVFVVRPFNHAGPRQSDAYVTSSFARQVAEIEAGRREPVLRVGNLEARRDITDVRDTVRAYPLVVARGSVRRPYNVCSGHAYRVRDLLQALVAMSSIDIRVEIDPARLRPSDIPTLSGSRARITAETGWEPAIPIDKTLGDLLDYWRARTRNTPPN